MQLGLARGGGFDSCEAMEKFRASEGIRTPE